MKKRTLLFLCTGNSCRSQMAEGLANIKLNQKFNISSSGVEAHGLNPRAVVIMDEIGIDISHQESKSISDDDLLQYDFIITLCGNAREKCPILSNSNNNFHWDLQDPAKVRGDEKKIMDIYRKVRDQISENINSLL